MTVTSGERVRSEERTHLMKHTPHHTQHKSYCTNRVHEVGLSSELSPIEENSTLEGGDNIGEEVFSDVHDYQTATYHNIHQVTGPNPTSIHTPDDVIVSSVAMETCQIKWLSKTGTILSTLSSGLACAVLRHSECESLDMHTPHTMVTYLYVPVLQFHYPPS